jgi:hypothetical protein
MSVKLTKDIIKLIILADCTIFFIVLGSTDKIFKVIMIDEPLPMPFSVIRSLSQRTIIDPVVSANVI